jgi:hypothetical protein
LLELKREFGDDGLVVPAFTEGELQALAQKPVGARGMSAL